MTGPAPRLLVGMAADRAKAVYVYDGRDVDRWEKPRDLSNTLLLTDDVREVVRVLGRRPLTGWRFWHRRFALVRASQATKAVVRAWKGLLEDAAPFTFDQLESVYGDVQTIFDWCDAQGLKRKLSAGAIGIDLLSSPKLKPNFPPLYSLLKDEDAIRPAIYGGRCEVFAGTLDSHDEYRGPVIYYDVNGAYVDVMRSTPVPYPYRFLPWPNLRAEGVTTATVTETTKFPVLPVGTANSFPQGRKRGTWTNAELRRAVDYGAVIHRIESGLHYVGKTKALQPIGEFLADLRERESDPVLRTFLKRIPNALIGRFASRPSVCVTRERDDAKWKTAPSMLSAMAIGEGAVSVEYALRRRSPWYACAWSAAILAEQRLRLHETMVTLDREGFDVLYCDTDGIMVGLRDNYGALPPTSDAIGAYKIEWNAAAARIAGRKAYVAQKGDGEPIVIKRAGVAKTSPRRLDAFGLDDVPF